MKFFQHSFLLLSGLAILACPSFSASSQTSFSVSKKCKKIDLPEVSVYCGRWREGFIEHEMKITVFGGGKEDFSNGFVCQLSSSNGTYYPTSKISLTQTKEAMMNPLVTFSTPLNRNDEKKLASLFDLNFPEGASSDGVAPEVWHSYFAFPKTDINNDGTLDDITFYSSAFTNCSNLYENRHIDNSLFGAYLALAGNGTRYHAKIEHLKYLWSGTTIVSSTEFVVNFFNGCSVCAWDSHYQNRYGHFTD